LEELREPVAAGRTKDYGAFFFFLLVVGTQRCDPCPHILLLVMFGGGPR
jgi:hypothetical protein